jgi:hypothetical protein
MEAAGSTRSTIGAEREEGNDGSHPLASICIFLLINRSPLAGARPWTIGGAKLDPLGPPSRNATMESALDPVCSGTNVCLPYRDPPSPTRPFFMHLTLGATANSKANPVFCASIESLMTIWGRLYASGRMQQPFRNPDGQLHTLLLWTHHRSPTVPATTTMRDRHPRGASYTAFSLLSL